MILRPRVIPCLLVDQGRLVKTVRFDHPKYVGDPINAVRIFNDKEVDELMILDIGATRHRRGIDFKLLGEIVSEGFMPVAYGGGVASVEDAARLFHLGVEKVVFNSAAVTIPDLVKSASVRFGAQSVIAAVDVRRGFFGQISVYTGSGRKKAKLRFINHLKAMEAAGAGEIVISSIDRDGVREGYDIELLREACAAVSVPVVALGGAGALEDLKSARDQAGVSALAAGSLFVLHGQHRAVLIQYPGYAKLDQLFAGS